MTAERHAPAFSRHQLPELCITHRPRKIEEGAGKAGCRPHPWPASNKKSWRQSPQAWPNIRPSLRDGFNGVLRALPGNRAFLLPSSARSSLADLTPASGCQDHTTSPCARAPFVRTKIRAQRLASIAARLTSGDDWPKRPSSSRRDAGIMHIILKNGSRIFLRQGLDGRISLEMLRKFRFFAQAFF